MSNQATDDGTNVTTRRLSREFAAMRRDRLKVLWKRHERGAPGSRRDTPMRQRRDAGGNSWVVLQSIGDDFRRQMMIELRKSASATAPMRRWRSKWKSARLDD